jgi:hypothetical protein
MYVSTMDVDDAVLRLFVDLQIPAGGRLSYATLVKEWPRLHLRHADLAESVQRLVRLRHVQTEHSAGAHCLILTPPGHERALKITGTRLPSLSLRVRMRLLQTVRAMMAGASHPGRRRRLRDRVAPQV